MGPERTARWRSELVPLASRLVDAIENEPTAQRRAAMGRWVSEGPAETELYLKCDIFEWNGV